MRDRPQLAGQPDLAEARPRRALQRHALRRARDRQRDREVRPRLVDPDAARDVHEDVGRADAHAGVTAEHGEHEREAVAIDSSAGAARGNELGRRHERLHLDQQRPRALHRGEHDGAGLAGRLPHEARAGVEHLDQAAGAHLEHPGLARGAEPVLQRADGPVRALALALELQHAVDEVLEDARAREGALLRDVPDEQHRRAGRLRHAHDPRGDLADLAHRAGRAGELGGVQRLHGIDDADVRPLGLHRRQDRGEVGLREDRDLQRGLAEALGPQADLRRRLLARHVQRRPPRPREVPERHPREGRLADPGRAA